MRSLCLRVELDSNPFTSPIFVSRIRQRTGKEGLLPAICRSRAKVKVYIFFMAIEILKAGDRDKSSEAGSALSVIF
uniref:Uncharacterized protein n=1 Tax=Picea glauca TaxID=3330 RepID=A0A101LWV6_PICGL|nr:hypothetical protein ABT39_MTgene6279 [Picea glauca]